MGDTADPSLGVWFEPCKGRNELVGGGGGSAGGAVCFDYFLLEGEDLRGQGGEASEQPDLRLADERQEQR